MKAIRIRKKRRGPGTKTLLTVIAKVREQVSLTTKRVEVEGCKTICIRQGYQYLVR